MSKHMTEWLNAHLDGELRGSRRLLMEMHLAECPACMAELETLENLSGLLHEAPAPVFPPSEQFATEVNLLLPQKRSTTSRRKIVEVGWWMIPVGLLTLWIFIGTSFRVNDFLSAANSLGVLPGISDWLVLNSLNEPSWSATLGQVGLLSGNSLDWAVFTEAFTRTSLLQVTLEVSIALLYLSWIAIWWARQRHEKLGQLLQG